MQTRHWLIFSATSAISSFACIALTFRWATWKDGDEHWIYSYETRITSSLGTQHNVDLTLTRQFLPAWSSRSWTRWSYSQVVIPYWLPVLLTTVLPTLWLVQKRRSRTKTTGLCAVCGYDLRATPHRCPECGTIPPHI